MGGSDELFRIGTLPGLKSGEVGVWSLSQYLALGGQVTSAFFAGTLPKGCSFAYHGHGVDVRISWTIVRINKMSSLWAALV